MNPGWEWLVLGLVGVLVLLLGPWVLTRRSETQPQNIAVICGGGGVAALLLAVVTMVTSIGWFHCALLPYAVPEFAIGVVLLGRAYWEDTRKGGGGYGNKWSS